jgi:hypothetical protein
MTERKPLFMDQTEGFATEIPTTDSITLGGLTMGGDVIMGGNKVTGLGLPTAGGDAVNKTYADGIAMGLIVIAPVVVRSDSNQAALSGLPTIDGITLINNDRLLLTNQTTASENGIWVVHAGAWTRPADFPNGGSAYHAFTLVLNGNTYAGTSWVCITASPNDVIDTNSLTFVQFSTPSISSEAPKIENTLTVDEAILAGDPVYYTTTNNRVGKGDTTDAKSKIIAIARTAQATAGSTLEGVSAGPCVGILTGALVGTAYYLKTTGGLSTALPGSNKRVIQCGVAINATDLFVRIVDFGKKA